MEEVKLKGPYEEEKSFIYLCYAQYDFEKVVSVLYYLQQFRYRISFDESYGEDPQVHVYANKAIKKCGYFICLLSQRSVEDAVVRHQIDLALALDKPFLAIHLDEKELTLPKSLHLSIADYQAMKLEKLGLQSLIDQLRLIISPALQDVMTEEEVRVSKLYFGSIMEGPAFMEMNKYFDLFVQYSNQNSDKLAFEYCKKSAELGHPTAQYRLAGFYQNGVYVDINYEECYKWYKESAECGYAGAQVSLGACYMCGRGVQKDESQGIYWFMKAADANNEYAIFNLSSCYFEGLGVRRNEQLGLDWLYRGVDLGLFHCEYSLGYYYSKGEHVEKDLDKSIIWLSKAAQKGHVEARKLLKQVQSEI